MSVLFSNEDITFKLKDEKKISNWIISVIKNENTKLEADNISVVFTSDEYLLDINNTYLNHNYYTDIITFDYTENNSISGDLLLSIDRIKENAETYNTTFENELHRVIIHGILHLLGYKDKTETEKDTMTIKENQALMHLQSF